jgi:hypothetical protein
VAVLRRSSADGQGLPGRVSASRSSESCLLSPAVSMSGESGSGNRRRRLAWSSGVAAVVHAGGREATRARRAPAPRLYKGVGCTLTWRARLGRGRQRRSAVSMADCSAGPGWAPTGSRLGRRERVGPSGSARLDRIRFLFIFRNHFSLRKQFQ